jgi:hypothetical protein
MSLKLNTASGGSITLQETDTASNVTVSLPAVTGTIFIPGQASPISSGTAVSASSTSIDFTSIPSWVKRITVIINGVSLNGSANFLIQLGDSGGVETSGYSSSSIYNGSASGSGSSSSGFLSISGASSNVISGSFSISNITSNTWIVSGLTSNDGGTIIVFTSGTKTLSATLDRIRFTTSNGTDTFDAGTINILYE